MAPIPLLSLHTNPTPSINIQAQARTLIPRASTPIHFGVGVTPPESIPNNFVLTVFGLIGASFVCTAVWFFCRAKNGGFYFKASDWDDYKSSVLRRKGPNGTTISGASVSTDLGGGSVIHKKAKSTTSTATRQKKSNNRKKKTTRTNRSAPCTKQSDQFSQVTSGIESSLGYPEMSEISDLKDDSSRSSERRRKNQKKKKQNSKINMASISGLEVLDETDHENAVDDLMAYRHEKPACVGGLNTESESSAFGGSTHGGASSMVSSEVSSTHPLQPTKAPKHDKGLRTAGIRKVISVSTGSHKNPRDDIEASCRRNKTILHDREDEMKTQTKRRQSKGRKPQSREFSFRVGDDRSMVRLSDKRIEQHESGHQNTKQETHHNTAQSSRQTTKTSDNCGTRVNRDNEPDVGTKSYHHPIPELNSVITSSDYVEERRRRRNQSRT